jgi:hypothetical protein
VETEESKACTGIRGAQHGFANPNMLHAWTCRSTQAKSVSPPVPIHVWPRSCLPTNLLEANINRTTTTQITPGRPCEILSVSPPVAHSTAAHVTVVRRKQYSTASEPMLQSAGSAVWQVVACIGNPTTCMQLWKKKMQVRYYRLLEEVRVEEQRTPKVHNMANVYGH